MPGSDPLNIWWQKVEDSQVEILLPGQIMARKQQGWSWLRMLAPDSLLRIPDWQQFTTFSDWYNCFCLHILRWQFFLGTKGQESKIKVCNWDSIIKAHVLSQMLSQSKHQGQKCLKFRNTKYLLRYVSKGIQFSRSSVGDRSSQILSAVWSSGNLFWSPHLLRISTQSDLEKENTYKFKVWGTSSHCLVNINCLWNFPESEF